ncbi:glycosyltransferase [Sphingobacterium humi]|uniref:Glycosyltransferase n=1 Tax=Sphingobacterium humi TaxID=1796905 RepID=A0A6N8L649_9SPHI|nr:glycosyltransferase [Sphingobacterium humi]MVZ63648.1 glycosyltransferase [Sphingobacterium humi]
MKIVHVIPSLQAGGAEKLLVEASKNYAELGIDLEIIVLKKTNSFLEHKVADGVKISYLGKGSPYNPLHIISLGRILKSVQLVHVHLFPALYWVTIAKSLWRREFKLVYTEHSTSNRRRSLPLFKFVDRFIYSKLDFIGCISTATKARLEEHLKTEKLDIGIISNGIDLGAFKSIPENLSTARSERKPIILQVSSFRVQKDQKTLIRSIKYLNRQVDLLLVGEGDTKNDCIALADTLGIKDRVFFLGIRSDVPKLMKTADIIVLSSNVEGFGIAAVEGMAAGKPVVASNIDGVSEIVGGSGILFEKGNAEDLSYYLNRLLEDPHYYLAVSTRCYNKSREFDIKIMVMKYIETYKRLLR